jgi:Protein of unknown function DUF262
MALEAEVQAARKRVSRDGYDMSIGELASLYERGELFIQPEYQRLRVWDETQKTRFIESVLLNIPIPPIFVFADKAGKWELVDGLQRISTILEFMGTLKEVDGEAVEPFVCEGTSLLPGLAGKSWKSDNEVDQLSDSMQVYMKRARIRVEILGQESDPQIKYELFQRLNTGGANLSRQEIRNCIVISINKNAQDSIVDMAGDKNFTTTTEPSGEERAQRSFLYELVVRFVTLRHHPYKARLDVHDFLDEGIISIAGRKKFGWTHEKRSFKDTFSVIHDAKGKGAFMKSGRFSLGYYEFITLGVSSALDTGKKVDPKWVAERIDAVGKLPEAERYTGSGVRGTQRLSGFVLAKAKSHFSL